jgi:protein phosphatase
MNANKYLKPAAQPVFKTAAVSHQGYVRENNEDRFALGEFIIADQGNLPVLAAVLCDGVGGHSAGEVAAQIGVDTVIRRISECEALDDPAQILADALVAANQAVLKHSEEFPETRGMGATCVSVLILGNRLFAANLGDSRAYLLRGNGWQQFTVDHTWLADNPEADLPEFAKLGRQNPLAHTLNRYLGCQSPMSVDLRLCLDAQSGNDDACENQGVQLESGDRLMLCSDGLTDMLDDSHLEKLAELPSLEKAADRLVNKALDAGGHDNITLILVEQPSI